ncbi:hypothetical protein [Streptomyces sp. MMG1121]|uniref:hypothetical protein n=1 Tax=Streptomyces sp. MMG1121 TaxID=1415544 RepID=UPI0006AEBD96|nr:hypothetical protein [Streptomyces sp. MMG1121]KOV60465.1 hypothetical protein ADK64_30190 [Streptomyces sp. MMG1121]
MDQIPTRAVGTVAEASRTALPPPALCAFLLLLVVMFGVAHAVGASVGPVAPGMHATRSPQDGTGGRGAGSDMGDMGGAQMIHGSGG